MSQCLNNGVIIKRGIANHVCEAADLHHTGKHADLVINCTGLSAFKLGGVEDGTMFPIRGQIVVVRNISKNMASAHGASDDPEEVCYTMTRAAGQCSLSLEAG